MADEPQLFPEMQKAPEVIELPGAPALSVEDAPREWRPGKEDPPWTVWDAAIILAVFLVSVVVADTVAVVLAMQFGPMRGAAITDLARDPRVLVPAQSLAYVITVLIIFLLLQSRGERLLEAVRWKLGTRRISAWLVTGVALSLAVQAASRLLPIPKSLPIEHFFKTATDAWIMTVFGCTVAPFVEELLFRGVLYPALARRVGMTASIGITATGFMLLHTDQLAFAWGPLLMLFAVGAVLTLVRARTGSLAASFLVHVGYNFTIFFLVWLGTDQFRHMERLRS